MRYHPDRNDDPRAAEAFILVNEAYTYLSDPLRREDLKRGPSAPTTGRERDEAKRRSRHENWEAYQREAARQRAARHAASSIDDFKNSSFYKATAVIDRVYNYVFIAIGVLIILGPLISVAEMDEKELGEFNYFSLIVPFVLGLVFIYGIWHFVFKLSEEE